MVKKLGKVTAATGAAARMAARLGKFTAKHGGKYRSLLSTGGMGIMK